MRRVFSSPLLAVALLNLTLGGHSRGQEPEPEPEDTSQPRLIVQTGHTSEVLSVAFSPDGRHLLSSDAYSTRLWDVQTGNELLTLPPAHSVSFSGDGKQILAATAKRAELRDAHTGKTIQFTVLEQPSALHSASLSPNGERILTGGHHGAKLWDARNGKLLQPVGDVKAKVHAVAISPDGNHLLIGSDEHAQLWNAETGKLLHTLANSRSTLAVAFAPKGKRLVTANGTTARIWDAEKGRELHVLSGHKHHVRSVACSPDGKRVLTGSEDHTARVWDAQTGKELLVLKGHTGHITSVACSPDGKLLLTGSKDETVRLWDAQTGQPTRVLKGPGHAQQSVVFSRDGTQILICSKVAGARLWDARTGAEMFALSGHSGVVTSGCFAPHGKRVLTGSDDKTARIWDAQTGKELLVLQGHTERVKSVAFSPDGSRVLTGSEDKTAKLWDAQTGQELLTLKKHDGTVTSVAFSPNGKLLLTGSDGKSARVWNAQTGKEEYVLSDHTENYRSVSFSPDGTRVLTAGLSKVLVWNFKTENVQLSYTFPKHITAAAFSPDGKRIARSGNRLITLLDSEVNNERVSIRGNYGIVTSVSFSDNGKYILTGCEDNLTRIFDAQTGNELCKLISFGDGTWAVADHAGRYDASKGGDVEGLYWVVDFEPIALSQLKERYYDPGLLAKYLGFNKQPLRMVAAFQGVKLHPHIAITQKDAKQPRLDVTLTNRSGGIGRVVVLINGKEQTPDARPRDAAPDAAKLEIKVDLAGDPRVVPGKKNTVEVVAYNADGSLSSRGMVREFDGPGEAPAVEVKPTIHAVIVGVSKYSGEKLNLRYAAKDAEDFATAFRLASGRLFGVANVRVTVLTGADADHRPTRANLMNALTGLKETKPGDLVVVYLAGHGVTHGGQDGDWYYLTADAQSGDLTDPEVRKRVTISSIELTDLLKASPAQKQVLILDTCHSGAVVDKLKLSEKRGVPGSQVRALERVKDRTGMHVLAGCAADSVSYEASRYGQGVLTYSLLMGMRGAKLRAGEYVDVVELFGYAADKVPELAREIGGVQRPTVASPRGTSFDFGQLTAEDRSRVPLQSAKPVLLLSSFHEDKKVVDVLKLTRRVNDQLREISAAAGAKVVLVDAEEYPGAIQAVGKYAVEGNMVTVTVVLVSDDKELKTFTATGTTQQADELARRIAAEVQERAVARGK